MDIGLIDVDSHNFPNLCLMKLAAYHKAQGTVSAGTITTAIMTSYINQGYSMTPTAKTSYRMRRRSSKAAPAMVWITDCQTRWNTSCPTTRYTGKQIQHTDF